MDTKNSTHNDEIDLIETFKTIWKGKFFIISFMLIGILLGFLYIKVKNPVYESKLKIEIENIPPFLGTPDVGKPLAATDFKNYLLSKKNFDTWKSKLKKNSLNFNNISEKNIIDGIELIDKSRNSLLIEMHQKHNKVSFVIKTNNFVILNDFYNYNYYIKKLLEKEYVLRSKKELKLISSKVKDRPMAEREFITHTLPYDRFITSIQLERNVFNIYRPSVPVKVSPKNKLVYIISSIFGGMVGLIIVFGRIYFGQNRNVVT